MHLASHGDYFTGAFIPENLWKPAACQDPGMTIADLPINGINARRPHPNQYIIRSANRLSHFPDLYRFIPAIVVEDSRFHGPLRRKTGRKTKRERVFI
jgi:hypothetical protein